MKKILIATDLSARSDRALRRAAVLAEALKASLDIVHVVEDTMPEAAVGPYEEAARTAIEKLVATVPAAEHVKPAITFVRGQGYRALLEHAARVHADLIVLGITRHTVHELFRGTTAERIVRVGQTPVLMAKDPANEPYSRVLLATDNSPSAARALAAALALAPGAEFRLLHVVHVPFHGLLGQEVRDQIRAEREKDIRDKLEADIAADAAKLGVAPPKATILVQEGDLRSAIDEQIETFKPDLFALGTHGRATFQAALIGSLAQDMLSDPPLDVLVAKV
jgi:nucleotide-binding universal stress UspA family protein